MKENERFSEPSSYLNKKHNKILALSSNSKSSLHNFEKFLFFKESKSEKKVVLNDEQLLRIFDVEEYSGKKYLFKDSSKDNKSNSNSFNTFNSNAVKKVKEIFHKQKKVEKEIRIDNYDKHQNEDNDIDLSEKMFEFKNNRKGNITNLKEKEYDLNEEHSISEDFEFCNILEHDNESQFTRENTNFSLSKYSTQSSIYSEKDEKDITNPHLLGYNNIYEKHYISSIQENSYLDLIMHLLKTKYRNIFDISTYFLQSMIVRLQESIKNKSINSNQLDLNTLKFRINNIKKNFSKLIFENKSKTRSLTEENSDFSISLSCSVSNKSINSKNKTKNKNEKNCIRKSNIRQMCINLINKSIILILNSLLLLIEVKHDIKLRTIKLKSPTIKKNKKLINLSLEEVITYGNTKNLLSILNFSKMLNENQANTKMNNFISMILFGFLGTKYDDCINQYFNSMLFENIQLKNKYQNPNNNDDIITSLGNLRSYGKTYVEYIRNSQS